MSVGEDYNEDLRLKVRIIRDSMPAEERSKKSKALAERLSERLTEYPKETNLLCFYPVGSEADLVPFYENAWKKYHLFFPRSGEKDIRFYEVFSFSELSEGRFRIMEPTETLPDREYRYGDESDSAPTVVLVPGLVFSKDMHRMGYGRGYYDRFLKDKDVLKIGICFSEQIFDFEKKPHDVDMDEVITEEGILRIV